MLAAIRRAPCLAQLLICVQAPRRGVQGHTIHRPRSDRARAMVRRHSSRERRDEGEGRIRITRRGRIAGSRNDKRLAEKALHTKVKFKLTVSPHTGSFRRGLINARTTTAAPIARIWAVVVVLLYAWVSLSHASLLVVGIRACKVMGENRFAGSFAFAIFLSRCDHCGQISYSTLRVLVLIALQESCTFQNNASAGKDD